MNTKRFRLIKHKFIATLCHVEFIDLFVTRKDIKPIDSNIIIIHATLTDSCTFKRFIGDVAPISANTQVIPSIQLLLLLLRIQNRQHNISDITRVGHTPGKQEVITCKTARLGTRRYKIRTILLAIEHINLQRFQSEFLNRLNKHNTSGNSQQAGLMHYNGIADINIIDINKARRSIRRSINLLMLHAPREIHPHDFIQMIRPRFF